MGPSTVATISRHDKELQFAPKVLCLLRPYIDWRIFEILIGRGAHSVVLHHRKSLRLLQEWSSKQSKM